MSGRPSSHPDSGPVLGFAATSRYLGCAVISRGEIVALKSRRVVRGAVPDTAPLVEWAAGVLERFRPVAVALLDAANPRSSARARGRDLAPAVHRAAARRCLVPIETCRPEIAVALRLEAMTTVAIRLELARRCPFVAAHVSQSRSRSETDRYWEPAVLGAAAALAIAARDAPRDS